MPVNDPTAIKFSNEHVRTLADSLAGVFRDLKVFQAHWEAKGMETLFPAGGGAIEDGSPADGRTPITADDVRAFRAVVDAFVAAGDSGGNATQNLVVKIAVNPR